MTQITLGRRPVGASADRPAPSTQAPVFTVTTADVCTIPFPGRAGRRVVCNVYDVVLGAIG